MQSILIRGDHSVRCYRPYRLALVFLIGLVSACATPFGPAPEGIKKAEAGLLALSTRYPEANATHVPTNVSILIRFNRKLDPASVSDPSVTLARAPSSTTIFTSTKRSLRA